MRGKDFASQAEHYDRTGTFVFENYEQLKAHRFFCHDPGGAGRAA